MTYLAVRLARLVRYLEHLEKLRAEIRTVEELERDLSRQNDLLFSLFTVCQLVIDLAGELSTMRGLGFEDYRQAVENLIHWPQFSRRLIDELVLLPGFRNVLVHEYVALDLERAMQALARLEPVWEFSRILRGILQDQTRGTQA